MGAVIDAAALDDAIERGSLALPAVAGMTWWVPIPGVTVRDSAFDSHRANQVAGARLLPEQIDGTVAAVRAHFGARRSSWNVGVTHVWPEPSCTSQSLVYSARSLKGSR